MVRCLLTEEKGLCLNLSGTFNEFDQNQDKIRSDCQISLNWINLNLIN